MKRSFTWMLLSLTTALLLAGCANYHLGTAVPANMRTIAVPMFENASGQPEADVAVTQAVLSELRREGTFTVTTRDNAALEMVGRVTKCHLDPMRYDRNQPYLAVEYKMELTAHVQVIERATGKVVANLGNLTGETIFRTQSDLSSTKRDAMPMAAYKLALQVVSNTVGSW